MDAPREPVPVSRRTRVPDGPSAARPDDSGEVRGDRVVQARDLEGIRVPDDDGRGPVQGRREGGGVPLLQRLDRRVGPIRKGETEATVVPEQIPGFEQEGRRRAAGQVRRVGRLHLQRRRGVAHHEDEAIQCPAVREWRGAEESLGGHLDRELPFQQGAQARRGAARSSPAHDRGGTDDAQGAHADARQRETAPGTGRHPTGEVRHDPELPVPDAHRLRQSEHAAGLRVQVDRLVAHVAGTPRGEGQEGLALAALRPAQDEHAPLVMDERPGMEGNQSATEGRQVEQCDELRDRREAPFGHDLAGAVSDLVHRDGHAHAGLVASAQDQVRAVRVGGLLVAEEAHGTGRWQAVHEPDRQVRFAVEGPRRQSELSDDHGDVGRTSVHEPDADAPVEVEVRRHRCSIATGTAGMPAAGGRYPDLPQGAWSMPQPAAAKDATPVGSPGARSGRRPRTPVILGALAIAVVVVVGAVLVATGAGRRFAHDPLALGERVPGYIASADELHRRAELAGDGVEPYAEAATDLLEFADEALAQEPSPQEPLEIPETEGPFVDDSARAYGLALAYAISGDIDYARHAARHLMAWATTTKTTVGTCPDSGACQTSLIIGRTAPGFVFAADLIADAGVMTPDDVDVFRTWLRTVILPTASELDNNWGDAGTFTRVVLNDYLGDRDGLLLALDRWLTQQDMVAADGHIPEETRRGSSGMSYTQESLQYRVAVAAIAERYGLDLWSYRGTGGATLTEAIDYLADFWWRPGDWPWDPNVKTPSTGPFWELAYARSRAPAYEPIIEDRRPYGRQGHSALRWTTLTSGVPFDPTAPTP